MVSLEDGVLRVGLTGGIASGKTLVADMFEALGASIVDTDVIARQVVAVGSPGLRQIVGQFGNDVLAADGSLDRRKLRQRVFADEAERHKLEAIVHPLIREETERQMRQSKGPYQIIVVPLLVESPLKEHVDRILVVDCNEDVQLARLLARDAESEQQARNMIAAQATREQRLAIADDIVSNDGALQETQDQVTNLHREYSKLA